MAWEATTSRSSIVERACESENLPVMCRRFHLLRGEHGGRHQDRSVRCRLVVPESLLSAAVAARVGRDQRDEQIMQSRFLKLCLTAALAVAVVGCPAPIVATTCTSANCANGCCSSGACVTANTAATCGLNASTCQACSGATASCSASGLCVAPSGDAGKLDSGTPVVDAGNPCVDMPGSPILGTLSKVGDASVLTSGTLPAGVIAVAEVGGTLYGLTAAHGVVHSIGKLPTLALGSAVATAIAPGDDDGGMFLSQFLITSGTKVMAGYTDATQSGKVAVIETTDGGVTYVNAPGNYTATAVGDAFIINGLGLGALRGLGVYGLRVGGTVETWSLATFDGGLNAVGSGVSGVTANGVLMVGYAQSPNYENFVTALPPATYAMPLMNKTSFGIGSSAVTLAHGFDIASLDGFGSWAMLVNGGFGANGAFTTGVSAVPLLVASDNVIVSSSVPLLTNASSQCTRVIFTSSSSTAYYVALQDQQGRRLIKLSP